MAEDFGMPITPAPIEPKKSNTTLIIVIVVAVVLLCCCCISAIVLYSQSAVLEDIWNSMWLPMQALLI